MRHETPNTQGIITADRFVLRPPRASDAGLLTMYSADEKLARATRTIPHPLPPGTVEAQIDRALRPDRGHDLWVLDGSAGKHVEVLGLIQLTQMDRAQSEVSYWIAPAFWNVGFATEALRTLMQANPHRAERYFAEAFQDNPGSARVLTNCGFDYLGDAEAYSVARAGVVPTWTYTLKV